MPPVSTSPRAERISAQQRLGTTCFIGVYVATRSANLGLWRYSGNGCGAPLLTGCTALHNSSALPKRNRLPKSLSLPTRKSVAMGSVTTVKTEVNGTSAASGTKKKPPISNLSKAYLALYNGVQTVGWGYVLFRTVSHLVKNWSFAGVWDSCSTSLLTFQSLAALEVLHCSIGLVPSNAIITFLQIISRVMQAWGIIYSVPEVQDSPTVTLILLAWGITEVVRYSFYFTNLLGIQSKFLTWCRYSLFYVLYPAGVTGEVGNIVQALPVIREKQMFSIVLPNTYNFSFSYYYFNLMVILSYLPVFPQLYNHMRRQRAKVLGHKKDD